MNDSDSQQRAPRILVVDDEALSRDMLVRRLASRQFDAVGFSSAQEAVIEIESNPADLILMDNAMPNLSGVDAVRLIRQHWSPDSLPIIMVSAMIDSEDVIEALDAGANDYVIKPIHFKVLLARVRTALRIKHTVSTLVEAERQRVMMVSLARAAASVAEPMSGLIDELEELMNDGQTDPQKVEHGLSSMLALTEQAVEVIDQLRKIASMQNVPYTARVEFLDDIKT